MATPAAQASTPAQVVRGPELVIGLVTPVGTKTSDFAAKVKGSLAEWDYAAHFIKVSDRLGSVAGPDEQEDERVGRLIDAGNKWCEDRESEFGLGPLILGQVWIKRVEIHRARGRTEEDLDLAREALPRTAYIIHSLKRPGEVEYLRSVYGSLFFLIGTQPSAEEREANLMERLESRRFSNAENRRMTARQMMERDEAEGGKFGQHVRKTFPMADIFVSSTEDLDRGVSLLFGDTTIGPTAAEYAMFAAESTAARSLVPSRRVGAAIVADESIVATGYNEVPEIAGEEPDAVRGSDTSERRKQELAISVAKELLGAGWTLPPGQSADGLDFDKNVLEALSSSPIKDVIEYQRPVHAEMWAILDAAARGIPLRDTVMYCTTWPCHLCWKHIFAVGIKKMYFIDSYPKSQAMSMYASTRSMIEPYVGVAPRAYWRLFHERKFPNLEGTTNRISTTRGDQAQPLVDSGDSIAAIQREEFERSDKRASATG